MVKQVLKTNRNCISPRPFRYGREQFGQSNWRSSLGLHGTRQERITCTWRLHHFSETDKNGMRLVHLRTYLAAPANAGRSHCRPVRGAQPQREGLLVAVLERQLLKAHMTTVALQTASAAEARTAERELRMLNIISSRIQSQKAAAKP